VLLLAGAVWLVIRHKRRTSQISDSQEGSGTEMRRSDRNQDGERLADDDGNQYESSGDEENGHNDNDLGKAQKKKNKYPEWDAEKEENVTGRVVQASSKKGDEVVGTLENSP